MIWFCFCFDLVRFHVRPTALSCSLIFFLCFQVVQIKRSDCKMSTKSVNNYKGILCCFWITAHTQDYKTTKKQIVRLQLNEKKSKESQTRLMS